MANRRMEFFIGMTVLGIFVGVVIMTIIFGPKEGLFVRNTGQKMTIYFEKAGGVGPNSPVKKNGIQIGRVNLVTLLDEAKDTKVRVEFSLNADAKIFSNEYARIDRSLFGDSAIEFVKNPDYQGEIVEIDSETPITGRPGGDISATVSNIEGDLAKTLQSVTHAAEGLTLFMGNLNDFLGTPEELEAKKNRLQAVFTELHETLVSIKSLAANMDGVFKDEELQSNIRKTAADIPAILGKVDNLMANANTLTDDFRITMNRSHKTLEQVEKNLDNIDQFTTSLADQGPEFLTSINESSADVQKMVKNIASLAEEIKKEFDDPTTTLGLLGDQETASSLRNIVANAEEISEKIQPVVDDARVFSNKIAHKPSELIWGKTSYKGSPASSLTKGNGASPFGFQPFSPAGGLTSPLYQPTSTNDPTTAPLRYQPLADTEIMNYETQNAYFNAYPDAKPTKSWLASFKEKCGIFRKSSDNFDDPAVRYPVYSGEYPIGDDGLGSFGGFEGEYPIDGYANADYSGATIPPFSPNQRTSADVYRTTNDGKLKFSLGGKLKNLFSSDKRSAQEAAPAFSNLSFGDGIPIGDETFDANYQPGEISSAYGFGSPDFSLNETDDFQLEASPSNVSPYSRPAESVPMEQLPASINRPISAANRSNANRTNAGGTNANRSNVNGTNAGGNGASNGVRLNAIPRSNDGFDRNAIPLGPISSSRPTTQPGAAPQSANGGAMEQLPPSINRIVPNGTQSSPKNPSTSLRFEDDGLPGRYVPTL